MTPVPLSELHNQLLPYLPAVEIPLLNSQIVMVARDFFKRTTVLREKFEFPTVAGVQDYQLNPTYGEVASIMAVWREGRDRPIDPVPEHMRQPIAAGEPTGWFAMLPNMPSMYPMPDAAYQMTINAVIRPKRDATTLPGEVVDQYREELCAGVLAAMYAMPGKPWTQSQSAKESGRMYAGAIKTIRSTVRDGGQPNQSTFSPLRRFGK